ncbi:lasso peptide biosynthesis B2 protein [Edaphobacter dinghuensis]|uniref:Microcin J25-processing protein McjB C-terminal domain-containing protein n=1 Tax=Edaphobacter dinghuensis TaxID=1560005 RepID=A0A917HR36_9BACT|nr:lasso peptide biosynthesis B2 protein [Edaphobacter dinghuensis]GGG86413.1 hypothetical protein GCM10011585_32930 [Edaphobacter dinghuensis]
MTILIVRSWFLLLLWDLVSRTFGFKGTRFCLRKSVSSPHSPSSFTSAGIVQAVKTASVLYFKDVWCLQRSIVTTYLLRRHGFPGELVIGATFMPQVTHAWVEIDGTVVNDKPYVIHRYQVLERY